jgi:alpha-galactosidase
MLKLAPSPVNRFPRSEVDIELRGGQVITRGHGGAAEGYPQWVVAYQGGRVGRVAAIQALQRRLRPYREGRDGLLLSNNWGDRSQDSRLNEPFVMAEIAAAPEIGIDVLQLDDGWQKGVTANSTQDAGQGVWSDYWAVDPEFWTARPSGFPRGLGPVVEACRAAGLKLGLWYSPDSSNEFANWERDADQLSALGTAYGVRHIKIDGVKLSSRRAEERLQAMFDRALERAGGDLTLDADVTAQVRLGFWGAPYAGPLFVENRYTDWHNYWPHQTLRTIWQLAHHINPMRLRMEFLNPYRNQDQYGDDPLAPSRYSPAALFATVMMTSPLAWFELSNAPAPFRREVGELVRIWKRHRAQIFSSAVIPIGGEPDGYTWTGFCTLPETEDEALYAVVYRPLDSRADWSFELPRSGTGAVEWLAGPGRARVREGRVLVEIDEPLGYGFLRMA